VDALHGAVRAFLTVVISAAALTAQSLRFEKAIALPGVEGRIDHLAADAAGRRLFVAALGNNTVEVIDLTGGRRIASLQGFHEPQGLAYVPETHRLYIANGGSGNLDVYDAAALKPILGLAFGDDADNLRYDAARHQLWVGYGAGALGLVDLSTNASGGGIKLPAHPESFQLEKSGPRIFVNVPNAGEIAVIDRHARKVIASWPVRAAAANFPMALDEPGHRLFTGCRKPPKVLVLDTGSGKVIGETPCVADTDDLFYDALRKRLYVAGGGGALDVFDVRLPQPANGYHPLLSLKTAVGARTGLYVPELNRFYLAVPHRGSQTAEIRIYVAE
jgi:DNA-binding beta-propeller fold protein YncE